MASDDSTKKDYNDEFEKANFNYDDDFFKADDESKEQQSTSSQSTEQPQQDQDGTEQAKPDIPNYFVLSILVVLFCCVPLGVVALIKSTKVDSFVKAGRFEEARKASDDAKKFSIIGLLCGVLVWLGIISIYLLLPESYQ